MLRKQHRFFQGVLMATDMSLIVAAQVATYHLRFALSPSESATYATHAIPLTPAMGFMLVAMMWARLYRPRRDQRFFGEAAAILKAVIIGTILTFAWVEYFERVLYGGQDFSRLQFTLFAIVAACLLLAWRFSFRIGIRSLRRHGWNLRHVAIIGTGRLGQVVCRTLIRNSWTGITPAYFISHHPRTSREECQAKPVHGGLDDLAQTLEEMPVSGVFIAIPQRHAAIIPDVLSRLERHAVDVRLVPDVNPKYSPFNMAVTELDGMPVLSVRVSPLSGWGRIGKRVLDVAGALAALVVFAPVMLVIALLVRMSGPGPVIFRQERSSLGGRRFRIYKFRTMVQARLDQLSSQELGKGWNAWTSRDDPRITRVGRMLRKTSLDELPQLFNVIRGDMSLVGPRPELSELISQYRDDWRGYMLRQHVKAGMTGWAQVNGLRGDSSLRKRLQYDVFYIRHWSIGFDLRILWLTIFRGFVNPNAH